jgi:hypothetical protein
MVKGGRDNRISIQQGCAEGFQEEIPFFKGQG